MRIALTVAACFVISPTLAHAQAEPTPKPATCDVVIGDDPEWQFADERCAFTSRARLGAGSFLLEFHSSATKSVILQVQQPNVATLFIRDTATGPKYDRVGQLTRSTKDRSCWVSAPSDTDEGQIAICAKARP